MALMDNEQKLYDMVAPHVLLENTRILAKGIKTLCQRYGQNKEWGMQPLIEFVRQAYAGSRNSNREVPGEFLAQNPHTELFRFRKIGLSGTTDGSEEIQEGECVRLAAMMLINHELDQLEKPEGVEGLSAKYEILCSCLRDIMGFDMCYITYRYLDETRILAASTVYHKHLHSMLSEKVMTELLDELQGRGGADGCRDDTEKEYIRLAGNAYDLLMKGKEGKSAVNGRYILVPLEFPSRSVSRGERLYLVFHRSDENVVTERDLTYRLRDALFLRGRLVKMLDRDFFHLLTTRREYRWIGRLSTDDEKLRILHLSDLHVMASNYEQIKQCIFAIDSAEMEADEIDFAVITGDVAQGRCSAGDLEENYSKAAEVIRELAFKIWAKAPFGEGEDKKTLSQDWKKRILIIPGNHDYASMNELETQHDETHRTSAGGRPATKEGSSMAKFTYYIDFMRQLLDMDTGNLIDNGLNEYRSYSNLRISFLCLNTSIMANPLRNNKVHLDQRFIDSVQFKLNRDLKENNVIVCLCHHGPQYKVDYLSDQYYEPYVCAEITQAFGKYAKALFKHADLQEKVARDKSKLEKAQQDLKKTQQDLKKTQQNLEEAQQNLETLWRPDIHEDPKDMLEDGIKVQGNELVKVWLDDTEAVIFPDAERIASYVQKKRKGSRLRTDYDLLKTPGDNCRIDERYQSVSSAIRKTLAISDEDTKQCKGAFDSFSGCCTVILSGHTHAAAENENTGGCLQQPGEVQYVGNRFFSHGYLPPAKEGERCRKIYYLHYGVCVIKMDNGRTADGRPIVDSYQWHVPYFSENGSEARRIIKYEGSVQEKVEIIGDSEEDKMSKQT